MTIFKAKWYNLIEIQHVEGIYKTMNNIPKIICCVEEAILGPTCYAIGAMRNVEYVNKIHYIEDKNIYFNTCRPTDSDNVKLPLFIYLHGGGWVSGSPNYRKGIISNIASKGYFVVAINYGLAPKYKFDAVIDNIYMAIEYVMSRSELLGIDVSRIYVGGESAGAHLACVLGSITTNQEYANMFNKLPDIASKIKISGLFLICGIYDMDTAEKSGYSGMPSFIQATTGLKSKDRKKLSSSVIFSPIKFVTANFPQTFIVTAQGDKLKGEGNRLASKLEELGVVHKLWHGIGFTAIHAFPVGQFLPQTKSVLGDAFDFFSGC